MNTPSYRAAQANAECLKILQGGDREHLWNAIERWRHELYNDELIVVISPVVKQVFSDRAYELALHAIQDILWHPDAENEISTYFLCRLDELAAALRQAMMSADPDISFSAFEILRLSGNANHDDINLICCFLNNIFNLRESEERRQLVQGIAQMLVTNVRSREPERGGRPNSEAASSDSGNAAD